MSMNVLLAVNQIAADLANVWVVLNSVVLPEH